MARKATKVNKKNLARIKELTQERAGFKLLRSVDCDILAKLVSAHTNTYINGITFKRLYGFTKYPFNPSIQTLDILSEFLGYQSWYEFEMSLSDNQPISNRELDILVSFYDFDFINKIEFHDGGIQSMSRKIALRFREDVASFKRAIPLLAQKKYAQIFFIEHFPDYDNLCNYYYLLYQEYLKHSKENSALLFGHSMLFLKFFLTGNKKKCIYHIAKLRELEMSENIYPYVVGRYFANNILFEYTFGEKEKANKYYAEYLKIRKKLPNKGKRFLDFQASEYIVAESLLQIGEYSKCIEIVNLGFQKFSLRMEFVRKGYYRQLQLLWLISQKKLDETFDMNVLLPKINPDNFYFISQKYFSVIYYYAMYLDSGNTEYLEQAKELSYSMGNKHFSEVFLVD